MPIDNAASRPLFERSGSVPDVSGGLKDWLQPMTFVKVGKVVQAFQAYETPTPIDFMGTVQPLSGKQLQQKPEGQRAWNWMQVHAEPAVTLDVDEVIDWRGTQYRVMAQKDFSLYGLVVYDLVSDWEGSGP